MIHTGGSSSSNCTNLNSFRSIVQPSFSISWGIAPRTSASWMVKLSEREVGIAETSRGMVSMAEAKRIVYISVSRKEDGEKWKGSVAGVSVEPAAFGVSIGSGEICSR